MGIRIGRREALQSVAAGVRLCFSARGQALSGITGRTTEWAFTTGKQYPDPFSEIELDVVIRARNGNQELRVPAFWSNDNVWRVRFAPPVAGQYSWESVCSDRSNRELHGVKGTLDAAAYTGSNSLYRFGGVRVSPDRRHFAHADGTPLFWLGDTWWMGLTRRLRWPDDFQSLAADRVRKGFTVVQIVAGLYPDMPWYDERGANEAGYPWTKDFERINPSYFDQADVRIRYLVEQGIMPCIVGAWGYYLPLLGVTKMRQHWRNLVARWGSLPVTWCLAGEGTMPYYLSKQPKEDAATQKQGWTEIARYVRSIDAYRRMITIHPSSSGRDTVEDDRVLDFDMLQTGHGDRESIPNTIRKVTGSLARTPEMPVINGEVCYEGILEASRQEVQRFMFWSCVLCGAAGHTYGANGIWQVNTRERPYGASPHGRTWGNVPWDEAAQLPGSGQLGMSKSFLVRYPWYRMEPHPEWVDPHWTDGKFNLPYAAGIPGELRILFVPPMWNMPRVVALEPNVAYEATFFNPSTGTVHPAGDAGPGATEWQIPNPPVLGDFVVVLSKKKV